MPNFKVLMLDETAEQTPLEVLKRKPAYDNDDDALEAAIEIASSYELTAIVLRKSAKGEWVSETIVGARGSGMSLNCFNRIDC